MGKSYASTHQMIQKYGKIINPIEEPTPAKKINYEEKLTEEERKNLKFANVKVPKAKKVVFNGRQYTDVSEFWGLG